MFVVLVATRLPRLLDRLGGAFPKAGQVLSTRNDLFPDLICKGLSRLQDDTRPLSDEQVALVLQQSGIGEHVCQVELQPTASATIAQVHRAIRRDDRRVVALKILRPGTRRMLKADCQIANLAGIALSILPQLRGVPVRAAIAEASCVLLGQTDFHREAVNLERLGRMFARIPEIQIPALHRDLSGYEILVMDYIDGMRKIDDPLIPKRVVTSGLTVAVCALFRMIFLEGFLHCDLHPGNMLISPDGRLVILDAGFVAELDEISRRSFAEFFLSIAVRNGSAAAKIIKETAIRVPENMDMAAFDNEISVLINRFGGMRAREFEVAGFVIELFAIQRRHKIHGTSRFTLPILSLLVFEGVAKQRHPDLDFQAEAVPYVVAALATPAPIECKI